MATGRALKVEIEKMKRSPRFHDLKTVTPYFGLIQEGLKDFEIRFDDRDFLVDDILNLQEYKHRELTGECVQKRIKYILRRFKGLQTGYVVIGLEGIEREEGAL